MQPQDFSRTVIGREYLRNAADGRQPLPINCFLDFINRLKELRQAGEHPSHWYDREIEAIKIILTIETTGLSLHGFMYPLAKLQG